MGKTLAKGSQGRVSAGRKGGKRRSWRRVAGVVVAVILVAIGLRLFVIQAFRTPSRSMEDTLKVGDCVLVDKMTYGAGLPFIDWRLPAFQSPQVGEVVVFKYPIDPQKIYVKRCLAVAGQVVEIRNKVVYVDGVRQIDSPFSKYIDARIFPADTAERDNYGPAQVPPEAIFVVGDNRDNSRDSRHWGFLPLELVVGRALCIYWSIMPQEPGMVGWGDWIWGLWNRIRWQRIGIWVQ